MNWLVSQPDRLAGLIWKTSQSLPLFIFFLLPFPHSFLIKHIHNISFKQEVNVSLACKHGDIHTQTQFLKTDRTKSLGSLHAPRRREMKTKTIRKKREGERERDECKEKRDGEMEREEMRAAIIQQNVPAAFLPNPNQRKYVIGSGPTVCMGVCEIIWFYICTSLSNLSV